MKYCIIAIIVSVIVYSCGQDEADASHPRVIDKLITDIGRYPDSSGLRMRLINSYDSLKMYKEAISQTDSLIKRDSLNNGLWFTKGQLQEDNKDTSAAIDSYSKAINVYPSVEARLHLANLLAETKNAKALLICDNVRRLGMGRETDADCNFIAGIYYARTGAGKQALQMFDKAINDNYTLMEAYMEKGFIYYDSKNYAEALKVFETAIKINNAYADAYYWRAKCEEALGNKTDALLDYKRSLGLDPQLKEAAEAIERVSLGH
jgi:tetratricopeptide (TPR) repeat protein